MPKASYIYLLHINDAGEVWWIGESELYGHCIGNEDYIYVSPVSDYGPSLLMNQISFEFRIGYNWTEEASTSVEPNELEALLEDWFKVISAFDIDYEKINQNTSQNNNRDIYKRIKALLMYLPSDQQSLLLKLIEKIEEN